MVLALAGIGLFLCFFGGRWFKLSLQLSAFVGGALLGEIVTKFFHIETPEFEWALVGGGAIAGFLLVTFIVNFGVFLLGALVGGVVFHFARDIFSVWGDLPWWGAIGGMVVGGAFSSLLKRRILMLLTAVAGGYIFSEAILRIITGQIWEWGTIPQWVTPLLKNSVWVIITAVGVAKQVFSRKKED